MPDGIASSRSAKALFIAGLVFVASWVICYETGKSLSYLQTARNFQVRMYFLFPTLVLFLIWFGFLHRWRESGKSGYQMAMEKLDNGIARVLNTLIGVFGLIAIPAIFSWASVFYAAWAANLLSRDAFSGTYRITDVRSVSSHYVLDLEGKDNHEEAALPVSRNALKSSNWRTGDVICARGRSSAFGTMVESISRNECAKNAT